VAVVALLVAFVLSAAAYYLVARAKRLALLRKLAESASLADRTQLLLLRNTAGAPAFTIDFDKGSVRTVEELSGAIAAPLAPPAPPSSRGALLILRNPLQAATPPGETPRVSKASIASSLAPSSSSESVRVTSATSAASAGAGTTGKRVVEIKWADLTPDPAYKPMFGGFGIVFVARWASKRKLVAVKVLKSAMLSQEQGLEAVQMLLKEAQGLMQASDGGANENVVQVFGVAQGLAEGWKTAQRTARSAEARSKATAATRATQNTAETAVSSSLGTSASADTASEGGAGATGAIAVAVAAEAEDEDKGAAVSAADDAAARELDSLMPAPYLFGLVMSFECGGSLQDTLFPRRAGRLPWPSKLRDKLRVAKEAATGLYGLHRVQIVHGDLKPENVMLTAAPTSAGEPHARLADFGLATIKSAAARASVMSAIQHTDDKRGTWPYMAPEMYRSKLSPAAAASRTTDVFDFGTLLHELLSGVTPWAGFTEMDRLSALLSGENLDAAELPKDTPTSVMALIARCLALNRVARPRMAEVLAVLEQAHENVVSGHFVS
jgi:hypothetical protein